MTGCANTNTLNVNGYKVENAIGKNNNNIYQRKIPKKIFQTWKYKNVSPEFQEIIDTWKLYNPDYEYYLYDDNDCLQFITDNFDTDVVNVYKHLQSGAFKADLWRYCILYIYGGVYVDIDTLCMRTLDDFIKNDTELMVPIDLNICETKYNLFNTFIACVPNSSIMLNCINQIINNITHNNCGKTNLDLCGPGLLGKQVNTYLELHEETSFVNKEGVHNEIILLQFEYGSEYVKDNSGNILFQNKNGNCQLRQLYNNEIHKIPNYMNWSVEWNQIRNCSK